MSVERIVIRIGSALLLASGLARALIPGVFDPGSLCGGRWNFGHSRRSH